MSVAYVDTSFLLGIAFGETEASRLARKLSGFDTAISANLLVAELRAAHLREKIQVDEDLLSSIAIVLPERPLDREIARVLEHGYLRGADCWHLAAALYVADNPESLAFLSLDQTQLRFARALGFRT
jgi:predicted nucleic acid-binding protein